MADRGAVMWCIPDVVADWRIHERGLSAKVLAGGAMKARLLALFERVRPCLSHENARGVAAAVHVVESAEIVTYDDYADAMAGAREVLHARGDCFGRPLHSHHPRAGDDVTTLGRTRRPAAGEPARLRTQVSN
jgi:hypothetical protein